MNAVGGQRNLTIFTWNLDSNVVAAKLALAHLDAVVAGGNDCVAVFQETPGTFGAVVKKSASLKVHVPSGKMQKNCIVLSDNLAVDAQGPKHLRGGADTTGRFAGLTIGSATWTGLRILAVHAWDRRSRPTDRHRNKWMKSVRGVVSIFWDQGPLIVAGDLNANPWSFEVTARDGWFARRTAELGTKSEYALSNATAMARQLVNPMWRIAARERRPGTMRYSDENDLAWHCLDQVLLSRCLSTSQARPQVLSVISSAKLTRAYKPIRVYNASSKKYSYMYSDHLPVELTLDHATVSRACGKIAKIVAPGPTGGKKSP